MGRGKPVAGFRKTKAWHAKVRAASDAAVNTIKDINNVVHPHFVHNNSTSSVKSFPQVQPEIIEPEAVVAQRIGERFRVVKSLAKASVNGDIRSLIISGPGGVGKSFTVTSVVEEWDPLVRNHVIIKGFVRPTGLFKTLYQYRNAGQVVIFDDADSIFQDDAALNILKAVCDTTEKRMVSWMSEGTMATDDGQKVPKTFQFDGTIIFISNLDFSEIVAKMTSRLAPHMEAMMSRSHYVNLEMKTRRHCVIRIKQVMRSGMLSNMGLGPWAQEEILRFIDDNLNQLQELSLRTAIKIASLYKAFPDNDEWKKMAKVSCLK